MIPKQESKEINTNSYSHKNGQKVLNRNDYSSILRSPFRKKNPLRSKLDQSRRRRDPVPGTGSTRTFWSQTGMSWYEKSGTLTLRGTNVKSQMLSFQIFTSLRAIRPFQINGAIGNERGSEGHGNHGFLVPQIPTSLCPRPSPRLYRVCARAYAASIRIIINTRGPRIWNLHERVFFFVFLWCRPVKGSLSPGRR